jgi:hypothetical protein
MATTQVEELRRQDTVQPAQEVLLNGWTSGESVAPIKVVKQGLHMEPISSISQHAPPACHP